MKIFIVALVGIFLLTGCVPQRVIESPVSNIDSIYKNGHLSVLPPQGEPNEWISEAWLSGSFSFEMRPNGDIWSRYVLGVYLSKIGPYQDFFPVWYQKMLDGDVSVFQETNQEKYPREFVFIDGVRCLKTYIGVSHEGANLKTASQRNKYYGSDSRKITYHCPLKTEGGGYKLVNIEYWADLMNPTIEKGTDINKSFADLNRRVQRSINSLKISRKDYFDKVNYRKE